MESRQFGNAKITLVQGDITKQEVEAIVNAANSGLMGGGGVDGAIHRAGGLSILEECRKIIAKIGRLPTGEAAITTGGELPAKFVIHTVGPVWRGGKHGEPELLRNAYINSLKVARENNVKTISFPSISTGIYRYPVEKAAEIALKAVREFIQYNPDALNQVSFVLFDENTYKTYSETLLKL